MDDEQQQPKNSGEPQTAPVGRRRRLLQGGLGAAPVLMTLVSRPVLGQVCQTTSQAGSMPTSHAHGQLPVCDGASPTFWSQPQNFDQWPSAYSPTNGDGTIGPVTLASAGSNNGLVRHATLFSSVFQPSPYPPAMTLLAILMSEAANGVAAHLAAAKLNVAKGWVSVLDDTKIQTMWLEYTSQGYYEPTAGIKWYAPEIVAYLQTLETK